MPPKKTTKKTVYSKMDPVDHILLRPEMYVGSSRLRETEEFVHDGEFIVRKNIQSSPALLRIFV
jgi:DNA gyrase/topoisomerase IV subunit B